MITKKNFAEHILEREAKKMGIANNIDALNEEKIDQLVGMIGQSSSLAVALDVLGYLNKYPEAKAYAENRGGVFVLAPRGEGVLSVRDMLELLPDEI